MPRLKVLFADDQIPDERIPDNNLRQTLQQQLRDWDNDVIGDLINDFVTTRKTVKTLRGAGYDVITARTYKEAIELVKTLHFDIAIVDLGWYMDENLPPNQQDYAGWDICEAIERADESLHSEPTLQIIYSYRFAEDASISIQAAQKGKLPVFKKNNEATDHVLTATVSFLETHLAGPSAQERIARGAASDFQQIMIRSLQEPLVQQKQWSRLTLIFVAASLLLILVGAYSLMSGKDIQVSTLTSISSILTGIISSLLFTQLRRSQKTLKENREAIKLELKDAFERLTANQSFKRDAAKTRRAP